MNISDYKSAMNRSVRSEIQNEFAYRYQLAAIPAAGICCCIAAVALLFFYRPQQYAIGTALVALSLTCFWLRLRVLPRLQHGYQLDMLAGGVFGTAAVANMMGAYDMGTNSPLSCGLLVVGTAFAFRSAWAYATFVGAAITGQFLARYSAPHPIDFSYIHLLILAPVYSIVVFTAVQTLRRHTDRARRELQDNVDALRRERQRRIESEKQLVHAQKMEGLGLVAAGVAHDFNNHLQAIGSFADLILEGDDTASHAEQIKFSADSAAEICGQMLAYAGKKRQPKVPVDVAELIRETQPLLRSDLPELVSVQFDLPADGPLVSAYKSGVRECFLNIVRNAIEACGELGKVTVSVKTMRLQSADPEWRLFGNDLAAGIYVGIEVSDTGVGMSPDVLERAFDPYFTTKSTGHGFGLATSLGIMRTCRGAIRVRTNGDEGTVLQMLFPPTNRTHRSTKAESTTKSRRSMAQNILLVDDDQSVVRSVSKLLTKRGCQVTCAHSAGEGLDILSRSEERFDLMLFDYSMPEMSGMELLTHVRERGIATPAVICTGYAKDQILDGSDVRPEGILNKPYRVPDLMRLLETIPTVQQEETG